LELTRIVRMPTAIRPRPSRGTQRGLAFGFGGLGGTYLERGDLDFDFDFGTPRITSIATLHTAEWPRRVRGQ
jgi:hypothetical protein